MEDFTGDNSRFSDWLICLDFMPTFLHCIIKPEVRSYCPELTIFWLWNEISVDLGFDYNLAVMIFLILLSLIYLLYLLFHNIWLFGTDISKVQKSEYDEVVYRS